MKKTIILFLAFISYGCINEKDNKPTPMDLNSKLESKRKSETIATIEGVKITVRDFQLWQGKASNSRFLKDTPFRKKMIERFLRHRMILKKAISEGYDKKPSVVNIRNRSIVRLYLRDKLYKKDASKPSQNEMKIFYRKNIKKFMRPAMHRFSVIVLDCTSKVVKDCETIKNKVVGVITKLNFRKMVLKFSNELYSRRRYGDIGFVIHPRYKTNRTPKGIDAKAIETAFSITKVGSISQAIKVKGKYYIFQLTSRIPELKSTYEKQKRRVRRMMETSRKKLETKRFFENLRLEYNLTLKLDNDAKSKK